MTASRLDTTAAPGVDPLQSGDVEVEAGVTIRWGITPDLTANLAINPDFSQVEADVPQLDVNNHFALFFPETRPFFLGYSDALIDDDDLSGLTATDRSLFMKIGYVWVP